MHLPTLAILEIVYVVVLSAWIIHEKRQPLATLAWVLSLAALPVVGFVVYFFLGPQRLKRVRSRRAVALDRVRASLPDLRTLDESSMGQKVAPRSRQLMALALNNGQSPLSAGNDVRVLRNGTETFPALEEAIRGAKHHVHLEYYIWNPDTVGARLRDLLVERARAGVQVRVLVDALGSRDAGERFFAPLIAAGGEFGAFNPVSFAAVRPKINLRNHRKIVVVDGGIAFTGGLNVGDEYAGIDPDCGVFRDTHLRVAGPAARALQRVFLEDWNFATGRSVTAPEFFKAPDAGEQLVQVVAGGPDRDWQTIQQLFFAAITGARDRVLLATPYFVPDEPVLTALVTASLRGVDVTLLVPRSTDHHIVRAAGRSFYDELLKAGIRVHEYLPGFLHAKTVIVDGVFASVGSANLDQRSFRLNYELNIALYGESVAGELETIFEQDLTVSREITAEDRRTVGTFERFGEACARVLSPLL